MDPAFCAPRLLRVLDTSPRSAAEAEHRNSALRIRMRTVFGSVSHAVRNTRRGARPRIFIRYGTVRLASYFAVSRSSQPRPFCTMSSSSASSESESFTISGKNILARAPRISATQAARRCQRFGDLAQRNTFLTRAGFGRHHGRDQVVHQAVVIGPTADAVEPRLEHAKLAVAKLRVHVFEQKHGGNFFFEHGAGEEFVGDFTRKSRSCSRRISRRQRRTARRKSAVYQPCDLISSLKNHCTPAACSAEPPPLSARRICAATSDGVCLLLGHRSAFRGRRVYAAAPSVLTNLSYTQSPAAVASPMPVIQNQIIAGRCWTSPK